VSSQRSALEQLKIAVGDLIDRSDERDDLGDLTRYAEDPLGFFRDILKVQPWSKQEEIAAAVQKHRKVHVRGAVGVGKDAGAAWIALWWAYAVRGLVLATSSTARQVVEQLARREIGGAFRRAGLPGELLTTGLRVGDETRALFFTSAESQAYRGFHHPHTLVLISEAGGVDAGAFEGLLDCAVGVDDRVLAYGNPFLPSGPFFTAYREAKWHKIRVSALEHPNVVERRVVIPGGITAEWVAEQDHEGPFYAPRVLGEFPSDAINALIKREWLEQAAALYASGAFEIEARTKGYVLALDVARSELGDHSCLCTTEGPVVRGFKLWREPNARTLRDHVTKELTALHIPKNGVSYDHTIRLLGQTPCPRAKLIIDARGVGGPVYDELQAEQWPVAVFDSGLRAKDSTRFVNSRAAAFWALREKLERSKLAMAHDDVLWEELLALRWTENLKQQITIESKNELRRTLGRSPDKADALAMAVGGAHRTVSGLAAFTQW
jgi:hypothetical protein